MLFAFQMLLLEGDICFPRLLHMPPCEIQVEGQTAYCRRAESLSPQVRHPTALSWLFQLYDGLVSSVNRIVPRAVVRVSALSTGHGAQ